MNQALTFGGMLLAFLAKPPLRAVIEEQHLVPMDDPQRDPNYCWTHSMIYPACAGMH